MEVLLLLLLLIIVGATNVVCFLIGAKVGQATAKGEEIKLSVANPIEPVQEHHVQNEQQNEPQNDAEKEQEWLDAVLQNVDNYDGTDQGQVDVPWR